MATPPSVQRQPLRELLREAGAVPHARLDATFTAQLDSVPGYVCLLQTLESFHSSADALLATWVAGSVAAPAVTIPRRTAALASDLLRLGVDPRPPIDLTGLPCDPATGLLTDGTGLALLYVTAGSSVGARVLLRQLPPAIPTDARAGVVEGAGPACAGLWRTTLMALGAVAPDAVAADATRSCRLVFEALCATSDPLSATAP